ncbi:MAG: hypothetical protein WCT14_22050 [Treponemataceae bacterium]
MKKAVILWLCGLYVMGCASVPSVIKTSQLGTVGIMTITTTDKIGWYGENNNAGLLGNIATKAVDEKTGETSSSLLPLTETTLRSTFASKKVNLIDAGVIQNDSDYKKADEDAMSKAGGNIAGPGYRVINANNGELAKKLAKNVNFKTGMTVFCDFTKMMGTGIGKNGTANAGVTMILIMYDENGKNVGQRSYFGKSKGTFMVAGGIYKAESLMGLFPEAINDACAKLAADLNE